MVSGVIADADTGAVMVSYALAGAEIGAGTDESPGTYKVASEGDSSVTGSTIPLYLISHRKLVYMYSISEQQSPIIQECLIYCYV